MMRSERCSSPQPAVGTSKASAVVLTRQPPSGFLQPGGVGGRDQSLIFNK